MRKGRFEGEGERSIKRDSRSVWGAKLEVLRGVHTFFWILVMTIYI